MTISPSLAARRALCSLLAFAAVAVDFHGDPAEYFSYFTILTNLAIGLWFALSAFRPLRWEPRPTLRLALTVYGLITFLVYWILLSPTHHPQGWNYAANLVLHLVVPLAMAAEGWLRPWAPGRPRELVTVLGFPLFYCFLAIVRGETTGWYPYFFLDKGEVGGWLWLAVYLVVLLAGFVAVAAGWRAFIGWAEGRQRQATARRGSS